MDTNCCTTRLPKILVLCTSNVYRGLSRFILISWSLHSMPIFQIISFIAFECYASSTKRTSKISLNDYNYVFISLEILTAEVSKIVKVFYFKFHRRVYIFIRLWVGVCGCSCVCVHTCICAYKLVYVTIAILQ